MDLFIPTEYKKRRKETWNNLFQRVELRSNNGMSYSFASVEYMSYLQNLENEDDRNTESDESVDLSSKNLTGDDNVVHKNNTNIEQNSSNTTNIFTENNKLILNETPKIFKMHCLQKNQVVNDNKTNTIPKSELNDIIAKLHANCYNSSIPKKENRNEKYNGTQNSVLNIKNAIVSEDNQLNNKNNRSNKPHVVNETVTIKEIKYNIFEKFEINHDSTSPLYFSTENNKENNNFITRYTKLSGNENSTEDEIQETTKVIQENKQIADNKSQKLKRISLINVEENNRNIDLRHKTETLKTVNEKTHKNINKNKLRMFESEDDLSETESLFSSKVNSKNEVIDNSSKWSQNKNLNGSDNEELDASTIILLQNKGPILNNKTKDDTKQKEGNTNKIESNGKLESFLIPIQKEREENEESLIAPQSDYEYDLSINPRNSKNKIIKNTFATKKSRITKVFTSTPQFHNRKRTRTFMKQSSPYDADDEEVFFLPLFDRNYKKKKKLKCV